MGFDLVGITSAGPVDDDEQRLRLWLAGGMAATMGYMHRDPAARSRPTSLLDGARSVIALGRFHSPHAPTEPGRGHGRIARYAQGRDYHRVLRRRLRDLARSLASLAGRPVRTRACVDSAPILERALAARAGLGFVGKNTLLIRPGQGSYFLLALLLTDLDLLPDAPLAPGCGDCTLCLSACPTGALAAPYLLDARRCISYLTIEHEGPFPVPLASRTGDWAFGCDVCQEACPYNRGRLPPGDAALGPDRGAGATVDLAEVLAMDAGSFRVRFAGTPLMRPGIEGMARNARAVVQGRDAAGPDHRAVPDAQRPAQEPYP